LVVDPRTSSRDEIDGPAHSGTTNMIGWLSPHPRPMTMMTTDPLHGYSDRASAIYGRPFALADGGPSHLVVGLRLPRRPELPR
jgi:hypothetical protein